MPVTSIAHSREVMTIFRCVARSAANSDELFILPVPVRLLVAQTLEEVHGITTHCRFDSTAWAQGLKPSNFNALGLSDDEEITAALPNSGAAKDNPAMASTLYNAPQSTCSQRVRFVLNAKGLPFQEKRLDLLAGDQLKPDYLKLNPNGVVPTLDHDGAIIVDSSVIIEYLDEIAPEPVGFTPQAAVARAKMRALLRFIDEMPAAAVRVPTFNLAFLPRFAAMSEDEFRAFAESKPLRKELMLAMGRTGFSQQEMNAALDRMRRTYQRMDLAIAESGGPWLFASRSPTSR